MLLTVGFNLLISHTCLSLIILYLIYIIILLNIKESNNESDLQNFRPSLLFVPYQGKFKEH